MNAFIRNITLAALAVMAIVVAAISLSGTEAQAGGWKKFKGKQGVHRSYHSPEHHSKGQNNTYKFNKSYKKKYFKNKFGGGFKRKFRR
jgi:hypothetical protein